MIRQAGSFSKILPVPAGERIVIDSKGRTCHRNTTEAAKPATIAKWSARAGVKE